MAAVVGLPATTVGLPALVNMRIRNFIDPNYNKFGAFCRSLKVFQRSYLHYHHFYPNFYNQMWAEYWTAMAHLYDVENDPRLINLDLSTIVAEVNADRIRMTAGISQMTQSNTKWVDAKCRIDFHQYPGAISRTFTLDYTTREQTNQHSMCILTRAQLYESIRNNWALRVRYGEKDDPNNQYTYHTFVIPYCQIHAEGFHKWLRFGNTKILLIIGFKCREANHTEQTVKAFHQHTIWYALQKRLEVFRSVPNNITHIHRSSPKRKVSYDLREINAETRDAFWGTVPDMTQNDNTPGPVKYMDLQIGFSFGDELIGERECTCNEFCNLNAFFHYNPIYRLVLVLHNQNYMRARTTVANMYQLALTHCLTHPTNPMQPTPIFELLISSSNLLNENHLTFHKKPQLKDNWERAHPSGIDMEGITYMSLSRVNLCDSMFATYRRIPFDEIAFLNIEKCMEVLYSLHRRIECYPRFVPNNSADRKQWAREYENRSHNHYLVYIEKSFQSALTYGTRSFEDRLFTKDYEQTRVAIDEYQLGQVDKWRQLQDSNNPLNLTFEMKPFTYCINQLWLSLTGFEPMSAVYTSTALKQQYNSCKTIHNQIDHQLKIPNFNLHLVRLKVQSIPQSFTQDLANIKQSFRLFYKLKIYSRVYKIQSKFLNSLFKYNKTQKEVKEQAFESFKTIWDNDWIEESPIDPLPARLFKRDLTVCTLITDFYTLFWGRAAHDRTVQLPSVQEVRDSVYNEYAKRRFWDRIDGNNRWLFHNIIETFEYSLDDIITQCQKVFRNRIMPAMDELRTYYFIEDAMLSEEDKKYCLILDEVVYWLMRGTCYMITGMVAAFLKSIDDLKNKLLVRRKYQYFLSKPGFVPIFQAINMVYRKLDELKTQYIAFNNPFDNITDAFRETKYNIKNLYSNYSRNVFDQWLKEFGELFKTPSLSLIPIVGFHLISGTAFLVSTVNHFRKLVCIMRKRLTKIRNDRTLMTINIHFQFRRTWDLCLDWFPNVDPNELAHPFIVARWQTHLNTDFTAMDAIDFSNLQNGAGPII